MEYVPPPAPARPADPVRMLPWLWLAHGALLVIGAAIAGVLVAVVEEPVWRETMVAFGFSWWADACLEALRLTRDARSGIAVVGLASAAVALWALLRRPGWRWLLQVLAVAHLVLVPWISWRLHHRLAAVERAGWIVAAAEVATVILTEIALVAAIIAVARWRGDRVS